MKSFQAGPDSKQRPVHDICSRHKVVVEPTECIEKQKHTAVTLIPTIKQQLQSLHPHVCVCVVVAASDYGMRLPILRSSPEDQVLYQTERYNEDTFGYEVPMRDEGEYILVMKFAEVYFAQSQQKVRKTHTHD